MRSWQYRCSSQALAPPRAVPSPRTTPARQKAGGTLTIGLDAETDGWNPTASQWAAPSYYVAEAIFDPLVTFGADNKAHPYLAESITPNADFTQWTIKLRPGITFQDGEPLNADALKLQLDKDKASFLVGQLLRPLQSTDKVDDLTVRVNMSEPWVAFPAAMASQAGFIAAPKELNATGAEATDRPIGTGPYVFKEWARDDHLTATKNPNYWRKGTPYPDQVVFRVIPDDQSRLASLQSKQIDLTYTGAASVIMQERGDKSLRMKEADTDPTTMIMLNNAVAPTDDLRVRQALSLATDAKQLISTVGQGLAKQADGPYLPDSPWYAPSGYPLSPDLNKARRSACPARRQAVLCAELPSPAGHRHRWPRLVQPSHPRRPDLHDCGRLVGDRGAQHRRHDWGRCRLRTGRGRDDPHVDHRRAVGLPGTCLRVGARLVRRGQHLERRWCDLGARHPRLCACRACRHAFLFGADVRARRPGHGWKGRRGSWSRTSFRT